MVSEKKIFENSANQNTFLARDLVAMLNFQSAPKTQHLMNIFNKFGSNVSYVFLSEGDYRLKVMTMAHMTHEIKNNNNNNRTKSKI